MAIKLPVPAIGALVRHQFYSAVNWDLCVGLDLVYLESEFRAVLQAIMNQLGDEFSSESRRLLEDEIIQEVCIEERIDGKVFANYRDLLNTKLSFATRTANYPAEFLHWISGAKRRQEREIETFASQFRVRSRAHV